MRRKANLSRNQKLRTMRPQSRATTTTIDQAHVKALHPNAAHGAGGRNLPEPGPFSANAGTCSESGIGGALLTSLLVMYPVVATILIVLASLAIGGPRGLG
jgi:hypothetical protein